MARVLTLAAAAALLAQGAAHAATLTTSYANFQANAAGVIVNTSNFGLPYYGPDDIDGNPTTATTSSVTLADGFAVTVSANEVLAVGTGYTASAFPGYAGDVLYQSGTSGTFGIDPRLSAFGFFLSVDLPTLFFGGNVNATVTLSTGETTTVAAGTGPLFFGFYGNTGVSSIQVSLAGADVFGTAPNGYAFGNFSSVPEPASLALLGAGLSVLGLTRRRARA